MYAARSAGVVAVVVPAAGPYVHPFAARITGRPLDAPSVSGVSAPSASTVGHAAGASTVNVSERLTRDAAVEGFRLAIFNFPSPP